MSDKIGFFSRFLSNGWRRIGLSGIDSSAKVALIQNDFHFTSGKIEDDLWIVILRPRSIGFSIILAFFVSVLFVGSVVRIDGGVTVGGQVMSLGGVSTVQAKSAGVIDRVHVRDGDRVDLGSLIISLDSRIAKENLSNALVTWCKLAFSEAKLIALEEVAENIDINDDVEGRCIEVLKRVDYDNLFIVANKNHILSIDAYMSRIRALESEADEISEKIPIYEKKIEMAKKDLQSFERLFDGGHASQHQVEVAERYVMDLSLQLMDNSNHLTSIRRSIERTKDEMENYENSYKHGLQKELVATKESLVVAASALRTAQNELLKTKIRATSRGVIQGLSNKVRGSVVAAGQVVAEIIQDRGDFIIAEGLLPPNKIAFFAHRAGGRLEDYNNTNVDDLFEVTIKADRSSIGKRCPDLKGYVFYVSPIPGGDRSAGYGYHIRSLAVVDPKAPEVCKTIISAGSPVEIMVKTYSRTPVAYMFDGLTRGMGGMFRD